MNHNILIQEKLGDVNGDGIADRVSLFGDKVGDSDYYYNIDLEVEDGSSKWFMVDQITELNGYKPSIFLGDFTKDHVKDILCLMDRMFSGMNPSKQEAYGGFMDTMKDNQLETIFSSNRYEAQFSFLVEYEDYYKISIMSLEMNQICYLDISNQGTNYLSQYYYSNGKLIQPVNGKVMKVVEFRPVVSDESNEFFDLLAVHPVVGEGGNDNLGYIVNQLSWNGEQFISIGMYAITPAIKLKL